MSQRLRSGACGRHAAVRRRAGRGGASGAGVIRVGEHLANTSMGNCRNRWIGEGSRTVLICRHFTPFRAHRYPAISALFRLDKAEVTGSSPVSPITKKTLQISAFLLHAGEGQEMLRSRVFPHSSHTRFAEPHLERLGAARGSRYPAPRYTGIRPRRTRGLTRPARTIAGLESSYGTTPVLPLRGRWRPRSRDSTRLPTIRWYRLPLRRT